MHVPQICWLQHALRTGLTMVWQLVKVARRRFSTVSACNQAKLCHLGGTG